MTHLDCLNFTVYNNNILFILYVMRIVTILYLKKYIYLIIYYWLMSAMARSYEWPSDVVSTMKEVSALHDVYRS